MTTQEIEERKKELAEQIENAKTVEEVEAEPVEAEAVAEESEEVVE